MTNDNQQPQRPDSYNQSPGQAFDLNSSQAISQQILASPAQTTLPEQRGPGWSSLRPMPAKQYQEAVGSGRVSPLTPLPSPQTLSQQPAVITTIPAQSPKRRRKRTPLIVFLLLLSILVAIGAIVSPNLFTIIPGPDPSSSIAFGATVHFVKPLPKAYQIIPILHLPHLSTSNPPPTLH